MLCCPRCDSLLLHRTRHWRAQDFLMLFVLCRAWRCGDCWDRFYAPFWRRRCRPEFAREWTKVYVSERPRRRAS